jgi:uncharacterized BrkB/YihY/UPF0761 family membrane protein
MSWCGRSARTPLITYILGRIARKSFSLTAAGLAYFFLMSLLPALILLSLLSSYLSLQNGVHDAMAFLSYVLPEQTESLLSKLARDGASGQANSLILFC